MISVADLVVDKMDSTPDPANEASDLSESDAQEILKHIRKYQEKLAKAMDPSKSYPVSEKRFFSLSWTFVESFGMQCGKYSPTMLAFGCGPCVYSRRDSPWQKKVHFDFGAQLCVFQATGTYVRGLRNLFNGYFAIWGGSYLAYVSLRQLIVGGTVCPRNILSTGRPIMAIKSRGSLIDKSFFEVYYADGTLQVVGIGPEENRLSIVGKESVRLSLKRGDMVTATFNTPDNDHTFLGTSQGHLLIVKEKELLFISKQLLNSPVKQITLTNIERDVDFTILLLFENGSIVNFTDNKSFRELKGRYTCLAEYSLSDSDDFTNRTMLVGDTDGNVAAIQAGNGKLEILGTFKNVTLSPISIIGDLDKNYAMIGSTMGEIQQFDTRLLSSKTSRIRLSAVEDSKCRYKTNNGWYFLRSNTLCKSIKPKNNNKYKTTKLYSNGEDKLKMCHMSCSGHFDRNLVAAYSESNFFVHISDYVIGHDLEISGKDDDGSAIIQVILMQSYVLIQASTGHVKIYYIDDQAFEHLIFSGYLTKDRIMAAACIIRRDKEKNKKTKSRPKKRLLYDFLIANGSDKITVISVEWENANQQEQLSSYTIPIENSQVIYMLTRQKHCHELECLTLSRNGTVQLLFPVKVSGQGDPQYQIITSQSLGTAIGNGHSLIETSLGIFAAGFKQHTLNICWIWMPVNQSSRYSHVFSVDTASSRLSFTISEGRSENGGKRVTTNEIFVTYYQKDGMREDRFTFYAPQEMLGFRHSGIITDCFVRARSEITKNYCYSGDVHGRFYLWNLDDKSMTGQRHLKDFKLNGAVTSIHCIDPYLAVSTSQGVFQLFQMVDDDMIQIIPLASYKTGNKITHVTSAGSMDVNDCSFMVFMEDGAIKKITLNTSRLHNSPATKFITETEVADFPVPTKMAICLIHQQQHYVAALGQDGILRRILLPHINEKIEMSWKISFIRQLLTGQGILLMVGDHQGRIYVIRTTEQGDKPRFYSDSVHRHEIIDMAVHCANDGIFTFSLDSSGIVVIRKMFKDFTPNTLPTTWVCPVLSPRKLVVMDKRRIMVLGKGVATKSF